MTISIRSTILVLLGMTALTPLSACSLTSTAEPPVIYNLHARNYAADPDQERGPESVIVIVPRPTMPAGFRSDRVVLYADNGRRVDYFATARWPESLERVLQDVIIDSARNAYPEAVIDSQDSGLVPNYRLDITVSDFQPVYQGQPDTIPELYADMTFTLVEWPSRRIVTQFSLSRHQPAAENNMTAIASGLEGLLQQILDEAFDRMARLK